MRSRPALISHAVAAMTLAASVVAPAQPAGAAVEQLSAGEVERARTLAGLVEQPSARWRNQERIDQVIEDIRAEPTESASGIAGAVVDADSNRLSLYWHGTVPRGVSEHIDQARADGIDVKAAPAPYTEAELLREADRISRLPLFEGARTGQRTMRVGPRADGSGLNVGIHGLGPEVDSARAQELVPALASSTVPVSISAMNPVTFTSRLFDFSPYWGGSFILNRASGHACTSAFGVEGNNGAATYLITAAHCGEGAWGSALYQDGNGNIRQDVYGDTIPAGRSTGRDVQLILPRGDESTSVGVYWGDPIDPPNGDPGAVSGLPVGGTSANSVGDFFCLSGSFTGTRCSLIVEETNLTLTFDPPLNGVGQVTNLVRGQRWLGHDGIVGQGDSGGPAASIRSDDKLSGRGVISAMELGTFERPCQGFSPPGRLCSDIVYFADLRGGMNAVGVHINAAP